VVSDAHIRQGIESYKSLEGRVVTFSCWVKADVADNVRIGIYDYNGSTDQVNSARNLTTDWEQLVVTKTIATGLTTYAQYPHNFGMMVIVQIFDPGSVRIDSATLVVGDFPKGIPFVPLNPAEDQARCERFFEAKSVYHTMNAASNLESDSMRFVSPWHVQKYATPTITSVWTTTTNVFAGYPVDIAWLDAYAQHSRANAAGTVDVRGTVEAEVT
jgi:hypothetical protein